MLPYVIAHFACYAVILAGSDITIVVLVPIKLAQRAFEDAVKRPPELQMSIESGPTPCLPFSLWDTVRMFAQLSAPRNKSRLLQAATYT